MSVSGGRAKALARVPLGLALAITLGVIMALAGFLTIGALLHLQPLYAGFLLLWFWTSVGGANLAAVPAAVLGACGGAANTFLLQAGSHSGNTALVIASLCLMAAALFMMVGQRMPGLFNPSYMLFVTVLNAPVSQKSEDFGQAIFAIVLGVVWFGASAWIAQRFLAKRRIVPNDTAGCGAAAGELPR